MSNICKNCGNVFEGNYCNNCGQKADVHPINLSFIAHDLQHGLFHIEGGIFYSIRELFKRPGHSIREYIEGKRVYHYSPISLLIVLAGFYGLFCHALSINVFKGKDDGLFEYEKINEWIAHHFSVITLLLLPVLSLSFYLIFKKQGYNFTEHLILNSFYSSQKLLIRIFTLPFLLLVKNPESTVAMIQWLLLPDLILMFWCYGQFFSKMPKIKVFFFTLLSNIIDLVLILVITTLIFTFFVIIINRHLWVMGHIFVNNLGIITGEH